MNKKSIDLEVIKNVFYYKDGYLYSTSTHKKYGTKRPDGYIAIQYNKVKYFAHRLIWAFFNGAIPDDKQIDHINRNKSDNRIENLRLVDARGNAMNRPFKISNTGIKGISKDREYYKVSFTINNKSIHVGNFKDLKLATIKAKEYLDSINN